ncbi:class I SAM-dependent methyltransferase [Litorimonas sp. RW-G-Af-16]|uniref:class I SAM-dependent methyltransferase n=1 Tax=Litorimonas sp. RW-G-Af-16 TaxID=3241168 RepID=UPI003AAA75EA
MQNQRGVMTCLTEDDRLPFSDATFDHILCVHAIEEAAHVPTLLRELWRVTRPEGRIVIVASNRAGLWSRSEKVPFGSGRPYSKTQLRAVLTQAGFQPTVSSNALYVPPMTRLAKPRIARGFEQFGEVVWPSFSGLVLVEAIKRLYAEPGSVERGLVRRPSFGASPVANPVANPLGDTQNER